MSREVILQAATANAARALEMEDRVGTLEAGKLADLIVVDGNPLEDLSALDQVEVVVQGGEVVRTRVGTISRVRQWSGTRRPLRRPTCVSSARRK